MKQIFLFLFSADTVGRRPRPVDSLSSEHFILGGIYRTSSAKLIAMRPISVWLCVHLIKLDGIVSIVITDSRAVGLRVQAFVSNLGFLSWEIMNVATVDRIVIVCSHSADFALEHLSESVFVARGHV